ncbi:hypothetical protein Bhyg_17573 [Pseudolycoriella hygida]|uniref:N-acetyltransferase domain-containing protein n=1 Tax=Pseudolycoriella hygida TaxID=35572 RepID=A0A9Q0MJV4_9DIPT|nr:hypothetical protein Bhyg_17573 [Pseudolycoriella hygida]
MFPTFRRSDDVPFPNVWLTFEAPDENGELVKYRIQDLPKSRVNDALEHMLTYFVPDENVCRARNMANDVTALRDLKHIYGEAIRHHKLSLVCFKEGSDEIIALNILFIEERNAEMYWDEYKNEDVKDMDLVAVYVLEQFDVFEHYQVDRYMSAYGLSVLPNYRRRGIGLKMLEARKYLGKACGIKLTSNIFSSAASQKLAEKAGFEKNFGLSFGELAKINPHYAFDIGNDDVMYSIYSMRI